MAFDLIPNKLLSFPSMRMPSLWGDEDDWQTVPSVSSGLSISEDDDSYYIGASLPGIDPEDVEITFQDGYLWIRGEAKEEEDDKKKKYYRQSSRSFSYRIAVPGEVDSSKEPEAVSKNGVMTVTFAKSPKTQPKKIQVRVK